MSFSVVLSIPSPTLAGTETFSVVILDPSGSTVFSSTETNAPFTVSGLAGGDYTAIYTFGDDTTEWCFNVPVPPPCGCPAVVDVSLTESGRGLYYFALDLDGSSFTPSVDCPLVLAVGLGGPPMVGSQEYTYSAGWDSHWHNLGGSVYRWDGPLGAFVGSFIPVYYSIGVGVPSPPPIHFFDPLTVCTPLTSITAIPDPCIGPLSTAPILSLSGGIGSATLNINYTSCSPSCTITTWTWTETGVPPGVTPDSGSVADSASSCAFSLSIALHLHSATATYSVSGVDCCGNTFTKILTFSCDGPASHSPVLALICTGCVWSIQLTYHNCGADCHSINWSYAETAGTATPADGGTFTDTVPCPSGFAVTHNITPSAANSVYRLTGGDCCGNTTSLAQNILNSIDGTWVSPNFLFASKTIQLQYVKSLEMPIGGLSYVITWNYIQTNAAPGHTNDSGTWSDASPCVGLPHLINHVLSPAVTTGGVDPLYNFTVKFFTNTLATFTAQAILP